MTNNPKHEPEAAKEREAFKAWIKNADWDLKTPTYREEQLCWWAWQARSDTNKRKAEVFESLIDAFTEAFETTKDELRWFRGIGDSQAASGRIVGMEDALSNFRPVMKLIENARARGEVL